jgi:NADPH:quinone reductase-like Zn-dependent oxidoreductase
MRYTVEVDGDELAEIAKLVDAGKVKPYIQRTFPLSAAADALAAVEQGHTAGKVVLTVS